MYEVYEALQNKIETSYQLIYHDYTPRGIFSAFLASFGTKPNDALSHGIDTFPTGKSYGHCDLGRFPVSAVLFPSRTVVLDLVVAN